VVSLTFLEIDYSINAVILEVLIV